MPAALRNRKVQIAGQAIVITALLGGTTAFVGLNKPVTVTVDGEAQQVRSFSQSVGDVLDSQGIEVAPEDEVQPSLDSEIGRNGEIVVNTKKDVKLVVDGRQSAEETFGNTVDQALADLGVEAQGAEVSLPGDTRIDAEGTVIEVSTAKSVQVVADGETHTVEDTTATVGEALQAAGIEVGEKDIISVPASAHVIDGQTVRVLRVSEETTTVEEEIDFESETKESGELYKGETKVETKGEKGTKDVTYFIRTVDGEETEKEKKDEEVTKEPTKEVVLKGTKERESSSEGSGSSGDSSSESDDSSSDSGSSSGNMSRQEIIDMLGGPGTRWYKIVKCESNFNPRAVNKQNNAHFGLFQFKLATWQSVGGSGNPVDASPQEQFKRAKILQERAGWGQWSCA